jgi:3-hydroxyisobutyrate dehydrogenase
VQAWNRGTHRTAPTGTTQHTALTNALTGADAVVLSVSDTPDVEALLLGAPGQPGAIDLLKVGAIIIDTSTIAPRATREMGELLAAKGILMVDAPVSGGSEGAQKGTLTVFLGGTPEAVKAALPYVETFAKTITHLGPLGSGQVGKAVNQIVISGTYLSLAEGILVGQKAGLEPQTLVTALSGGSARSWALENRWERMANDTYPLGFKVALHRKDLGIAIGLADELNVPVPTAMLVAHLEDELIKTGHADEDISALARRLRDIANEIDPA